jgi:DNA-directed RNA polymerase specialized sigma24 family protein
VAGEDEFAEFVAAALPGLLRFGHVLTGNAREAEDLVQTALGRSLRAWRLRRAGRRGGLGHRSATRHG